MKTTLFIFTFTLALAASAHGQYTYSVNSVAGGAFENLVNEGSANSNMRLPTDGDAAAASFFTDNSVFATLFISGIGNVDVYKAGVANTAKDTPAAGAWRGSSNPQTFTINVVGTPTAHGTNPGPRWRYLRTFNNGVSENGSWSDITVGENTLSINEVSFARMVGFQIAGVVDIDSFSHDYGSDVDTLSISVVPEPSSYALLAGLFASTYMMVRRRKISQVAKTFFKKPPLVGGFFVPNNKALPVYKNPALFSSIS